MARVSGDHGKMYSKLPQSTDYKRKETETFDETNRAVPLGTPKSDTPLVPSGLGSTSVDTGLLTGPRRGDPVRAEEAKDSKFRRAVRVFTSLPCRLLLIVMFVSLIGIYCFVSLVLEPSIKKGIKDILIMRPNVSEAWEHPKADIFVRIHFFNLTNPEEAINEGQPFKLQETGPYVYRIVTNKVDVIWNANSTVSYRERNVFSFDPSLSTGDEEDIIRTVDVPFLAMTSHLPSGRMQSLITDMFKSGSNLFTSRSVKDLLWGYKDSILENLDYLKWFDIFKLFKDVDQIPSKFGFLVTLNDTPTSVYNVYTGESNFSQLNDVYSYNYQRFLNGSPSNEPVRLHGSAGGAMFPPPVDENSILAFFFGPLFKTFNLEFHQPSIYEGLHTYTFKIPDSQFSLEVPEFPGASPLKVNPPSEAMPKKTIKRDTTTPSTVDQMKAHLQKFANGTLKWTNSDRKNKKCVNYLRGVASMEPLSKGAPIFFSFPHFLGADANLMERIEGLKPQEDLHRSYLDIHPRTGVTPHFRFRYQINSLLDLKKLSKKKSEKSSILLPMVWIDTTARVDQLSLHKLVYLELVINSINYTAIASVAVLGAVGVFLLLQLIIGVIQYVTDERSTFIHA